MPQTDILPLNYNLHVAALPRSNCGSRSLSINSPDDLLNPFTALLSHQGSFLPQAFALSRSNCGSLKCLRSLIFREQASCRITTPFIHSVKLGLSNGRGPTRTHYSLKDNDRREWLLTSHIIILGEKRPTQSHLFAALCRLSFVRVER